MHLMRGVWHVVDTPYCRHRTINHKIPWSGKSGLSRGVCRGQAESRTRGFPQNLPSPSSVRQPYPPPPLDHEAGPGLDCPGTGLCVPETDQGGLGSVGMGRSATATWLTSHSAFSTASAAGSGSAGAGLGGRRWAACVTALVRTAGRSGAGRDGGMGVCPAARRQPRRDLHS